MPAIPLRATYRVQLTPRFGFDRAAAVLDYLERLGVSHLYSSPYLQAAPGSEHGYDVVDHSRVNEELGGEEGRARLCEKLAEHGMGQVLDIVPNHMAITGRGNRWWWDVLENGPSSRYASYFDVSWDPPERRLKHRILLPALGDHYGRILESGQLRLIRQGPHLMVRYQENEYPIDPRTYGTVLAEELPDLAREFAQLAVLTPDDRAGALRRHHQAARLLSRLEAPAAQARLETAVRGLNSDVERLDGLLELQNYRLARWQTARYDLDYRRFFDVNSLVALRAEDPEVFEQTHRRVLEWANAGVLDGIRVDHPDGLRDPFGYFRRLSQAAPRAWVVAEKILARQEELPSDWPIAGTTGYDFLNRALRVLVDERAEEAMTEIYVRFTGEIAAYPEIEHEKKHQAMRDLLGSDVNQLGELFVRVCEDNRRYRDFTRPELVDCLTEVIACLPVYRTYVRPEAGAVSDADRAQVEAALGAAARRRPDLDRELLALLGRLLLLEEQGEHTAALVARFQETSGPVTAKGVEDTAFYVYNRLLALNEVGGDPARFGEPPEHFHDQSLWSREHWPRSMLATSTHDTKRSEDVRARLAVLSEIPDLWQSALQRWAELNRLHRSDGLPDAGTEYQLYQTLVGAWPIGAERAVGYLIKAAREAKTRTSWVAPIPEYESALESFVTRVLADQDFLADLLSFLPPVIEAGWVNSLAMKLLCLTAPGIPDLYQGSELWDLSLVDPDNRRPVDYAQRRRLLRRLESAGEQAAAIAWEERESGLPKLLLVQRALALRAQRTKAFDAGDYRPLEVVGEKARHALGFVRGGVVAVLVPRLTAVLGGDWAGTSCELPQGAWVDSFTGARCSGGPVPVEEILAGFPVALLALEGR